MFVHIRALETPRTPARRLTHRPGGWGWVTLLLPMSNPINHIATSSPLSPREQQENAEKPMGGTGAPDYILETLPRTRRCGWKLLGLGCKIKHPKKPPFTPINQLNGIQMLNEPSQGSLTQPCLCQRFLQLLWKPGDPVSSTWFSFQKNAKVLTFKFKVNGPN